MKLEIRTFTINPLSSSEDEARLASFLRTVDVVRIDTAYAADAWRILVQYQDMRRDEETAQIEMAISSAINSWRGEVAKATGVDRDEVLPTGLVNEIARYAPTTEVELSVIVGASGFDIGDRGGQIVQVVRQTMEELS